MRAGAKIRIRRLRPRARAGRRRGSEIQITQLRLPAKINRRGFKCAGGCSTRKPNTRPRAGAGDGGRRVRARRKCPSCRTACRRKSTVISGGVGGRGESDGGARRHTRRTGILRPAGAVGRVGRRTRRGATRPRSLRKCIRRRISEFVIQVCTTDDNERDEGEHPRVFVMFDDLFADAGEGHKNKWKVKSL